ncbi:MAG: nitrile hydratase subunit beta [Hyphomicrobiaceae bacterium]
MNGVHDMGGMDGFGKVVAPPAEPPFHAAWEGRVLAMNRAMQSTGEWNIDVGRYWIEILPPHVYLAATYYQKWFVRLENLCVARGLVTRQEIAAGHSAGPGRPLKGKPLAAADALRLTVRANFERPAPAPARFKLGDRVRAKNMHPASHTRLPRYVRGHTGVVERLHGCHVYPDAVVADGIENPQWLYTVTFDNRDLWGPEADPTVKVSVDAFEPYLEIA